MSPVFPNLYNILYRVQISKLPPSRITNFAFSGKFHIAFEMKIILTRINKQLFRSQTYNNSIRKLIFIYFKIRSEIAWGEIQITWIIPITRIYFIALIVSSKDWVLYSNSLRLLI